MDESRQIGGACRQLTSMLIVVNIPGNPVPLSVEE